MEEAKNLYALQSWDNNSSRSNIPSILQFLISNYGGQTAQKFEDATKKCVELLQVNPALFKFNVEFQCRKAIIDRYTSMFYEVKNLVKIVHLFKHDPKNSSNISIQRWQYIH